MYMANANPCIPNANYIPLARVGSVGARVGSVGACVGSGGLRVGSGALRWVRGVFRYQHVGIGNANPSHWGPYPTQRPNANGFALQWNIGSRNLVSV